MLWLARPSTSGKVKYAQGCETEVGRANERSVRMRQRPPIVGQPGVGETAFRCSDRLKGTLARFVFPRAEHEENENQLEKRLHGNVSLIKLSAF